MRTYLFAAALAGTVLGGGTALVAQPGPGGGMMASADTNGDGTISHAEFLAAAAARFARMDANGDGKLSGDELQGRGTRMLQPGAHGTVSKDAFMAQAQDHFTRLDANHDGAISKDEMQAMMGRFHGGQGGPNPGNADAPPPPGGPGHRHGMWADHMAKLDANHDGRISREEMRAASDARFARLDTNHDGFVDKAEMDAARDRRMAKHHGPHGDMPPPPPSGAAAAPKPDAGQ